MSTHREKIRGILGTIGAGAREVGGRIEEMGVEELARELEEIGMDVERARGVVEGLRGEEGRDGKARGRGDLPGVLGETLFERAEREERERGERRGR